MASKKVVTTWVKVGTNKEEVLAAKEQSFDDNCASVSIKSKDRVKNAGEVFTPIPIVNDMADLVKDKAEDINSTFLEPACGNGNFIAELLKRKLKTAYEKCENSTDEYELNIVKSVCSLYAIDIDEENVIECKQRVNEIVEKEYISKIKANISEELKKIINYVLDRNIILGNSLTGRYIKNNSEIEIYEWQFNGTVLEVKMTFFNDIDGFCNVYNEIDYRQLGTVVLHINNEKTDEINSGKEVVTEYKKEELRLTDAVSSDELADIL